MKKLLTFAALCFGMFTVANAQYEPEKGDFAVELGFSPFNTDDGKTFDFNEDGQFKVRWFFSDKNALRLKIGLGFDKDTKTETESFDPTIKKDKGYDITNKTTETTEKNTNFSFMLGYERHLFTKGRFDVYAGLELGYGLYKTSGSITVDERTDTYDKDNEFKGYTITKNETNYTNSSPFGAGGSLSVFKGNLFAGVDVYVWKNLYLGAELGMGFNTGKSLQNSYYCFDNKTTAYDEKGKDLGHTYRNYDGEANTTTIEFYNGTETKTFIVNGEETLSTAAPTSTITKKSNNIKKSTEWSNTGFKFYVEPAIRIGWKF